MELEVKYEKEGVRSCCIIHCHRLNVPTFRRNVSPLSTRSKQPSSSCNAWHLHYRNVDISVTSQKTCNLSNTAVTDY